MATEWTFEKAMTRLEQIVAALESGRCTVTLETDQTVEDQSVCRDVFFAFSRAERAILQMSTAKASLENIFLELTREESEPSRTKRRAKPSEGTGDVQ